MPNADHRRSQLVRLTELGQAKYEAIGRKQAAWVNGLADGLRRSDLETTARVLASSVGGEADPRGALPSTEGGDRHRS
jgi:DNA-binding MarR family transcriptional regulator